MNRTAVLLLQMGGPDSPDAIRPFLLNLFTDREIIKIGPAWLQPLIARIIVSRRTPKVTEKYGEIGGKSPIRELTQKQADALSEKLGIPCYVGMRYWKPFTGDTLKQIRKDGIRRVVALSLYPHYSRATSGSSFNDLTRCLADFESDLEVIRIKQFYNHPLYIDALAEKIAKGLAGFSDQPSVHLLFSAHSLPQSFIDEGDPYLEHIRETVRLVMERFCNVRHHLAFQSRAGPVKWLEPSTEEKLHELASIGCKQLLVVPLSFVSDHIETLHEIDIEYAAEAHKSGISDFRRIESLNSSPAFIHCLEELVLSALQSS